MALERYRLKTRSELEYEFNRFKAREDAFIADGLDFGALLVGEPSVIPLFSCCKCLKKPALTREDSVSKKTRNPEHKQYRWRYTCTECGSTPSNHSKSIFLAKLEWNFNNYLIWESDRVPVFNLRYLSLPEKKSHLHYIREVLECRVNKMEAEYFLEYANAPESVRKQHLDDIERYKLFLHWQQVAQRIVAHEIKRSEQ